MILKSKDCKNYEMHGKMMILKEIIRIQKHKFIKTRNSQP